MTMPVMPILKHGACPTDWFAQGNYCVANTANPKNVVPKSGSCPSGYYVQANCCVQN